MIVRVRVVFSGRVQGVFFRAHAQKFAQEREVNGWIKNMSDGRVEALFEGERENVDEVIRLCRKAQPYARVDSIDIVNEEPQGDTDGFKIRY